MVEKNTIPQLHIPLATHPTSVIALHVEGIGIPIDWRFPDAVRARADQLAKLHPDFMRVDPNRSLVVSTGVERASFDRIRHWLHTGETLPEPSLKSGQQS